MDSSKLLGFVIAIIVAIIALLNAKKIREKNKTEIESMEKYDAEIQKELHFNEYVTYKNSKYQSYKDSVNVFIIAIVVILILFLSFIGIVNLR